MLTGVDLFVRLFIALSFSSDEADRIEAITGSFERHIAHGRTTNRDHFHITLVFLGDTAFERLPLVKAAMDRVRGKPFELCIAGISAFKGRRKGATFFLYVRPNRTLFAIERALRTELDQQGFSIDQRPYHPHLTIARNTVLKDPDALDRLNEGFKPIRARIDRIELFRSIPKKQGPVYTVLYEKRF